MDKAYRYCGNLLIIIMLTFLEVYSTKQDRLAYFHTKHATVGINKNGILGVSLEKTNGQMGYLNRVGKCKLLRIVSP